MSGSQPRPSLSLFPLSRVQCPLTGAMDATTRPYVARWQGKSEPVRPCAGAAVRQSSPAAHGTSDTPTTAAATAGQSTERAIGDNLRARHGQLSLRPELEAPNRAVSAGQGIGSATTTTNAAPIAARPVRSALRRSDPLRGDSRARPNCCAPFLCSRREKVDSCREEIPKSKKEG